MREVPKQTPLDPDSEQQLFEKLSLDKHDLDMLNYIRHHVKIIIKQENGRYKNNKSNLDN